MEEVQDSEEAKEDEIIVEEDECPITNIFEVLHNPTFVEADNNDNVCMKNLFNVGKKNVIVCKI